MSFRDVLGLPGRSLCSALSLIVLGGAFLLLPATAALADYAPKWTDAELVEFSRVVVTGQVVDVGHAADDSVGGLYTYITVGVDQVIKGRNVPPRIVVKQLGGHLDDRVSSVVGQARFRVGERVLLFLERRPRDGTLYTSALWQGKWSLVDDRDSDDPADRIAVRYWDGRPVSPGIEAALGDPDDAKVDRRPSRPFLARLEQLSHRGGPVARSLGGTGSTADVTFLPPEAPSPSLDDIAGLDVLPTNDDEDDSDENDDGVPDIFGFALIWADEADLIGIRFHRRKVNVRWDRGGQKGVKRKGKRATKRGIKRWRKVKRTSIKVNPKRDRVRGDERCLSSARERFDGRFLIAFNNACQEFDPEGGTLGATTHNWDETDLREASDLEFARIVAINIVINETNDFLAQGLCFENTVAHEVGHGFGLGHSNNPHALMYNFPVADCRTGEVVGDPGPVSGQLHTDDREGFRYIYPKGGAETE